MFKFLSDSLIINGINSKFDWTFITDVLEIIIIPSKTPRYRLELNLKNVPIIFNEYIWAYIKNNTTFSSWCEWVFSPSVCSSDPFVPQFCFNV